MRVVLEDGVFDLGGGEASLASLEDLDGHLLDCGAQPLHAPATSLAHVVEGRINPRSHDAIYLVLNFLGLRKVVVFRREAPTQASRNAYEYSSFGP